MFDLEWGSHRWQLLSFIRWIEKPLLSPSPLTPTTPYPKSPRSPNYNIQIAHYCDFEPVWTSPFERGSRTIIASENRLGVSKWYRHSGFFFTPLDGWEMPRFSSCDFRNWPYPGLYRDIQGPHFTSLLNSFLPLHSFHCTFLLSNRNIKFQCWWPVVHLRILNTSIQATVLLEY